MGHNDGYIYTTFFETNPVIKSMWIVKKGKRIAHKSWAGVGSNAPLEPMVAAAMTCTAQPQSIEARPAIIPIVFASGNKRGALTQWAEVEENTYIQLTSRVEFSNAG